MNSLQGRMGSPATPLQCGRTSGFAGFVSGLEHRVSPVFRLSGVLAAFFLLLILLFVLAQIGARLAGTVVPSADEFAGFSLSASSFLALGYAFRQGVHIRVTILRERISPAYRLQLDRIAIGMAVVLVSYLTYFVWELVIDSFDFGDMTEGLIPLPLWLPQCGMVAGITVLCLAVWVECLRTWAGIGMEPDTGADSPKCEMS
jgi:TRAP-type C4-dicarboxylate transport system permease small subunit